MSCQTSVSLNHRLRSPASSGSSRALTGCEASCHTVSPPHRIPVLLNQMEAAIRIGDDEREVRLLHHTIDAVGAVVAEYLVFPHSHPAVGVHHRAASRNEFVLGRGLWRLCGREVTVALAQVDRRLDIGASMAAHVDVEVGERTVRITNPDRMYFPALGQTKLDLVRYYMSVGEGIVRALRDRPCMMHRFPSGVAGEKVHQKRVPSGAP